MAAHADLTHDYRCCRSNVTTIEQAPRDLDNRFAWIGPKSRNGVLFEAVQLMRLTARKRQLRNEAVFHRAFVSADPLAELDRQRRRYRDSSYHLSVVVSCRHRAGRLKYAADYVRAIECSHIIDNSADLAGLCPQQAFRKLSQVQQNRHRQSEEAKRHCQD